MAFEDLGQYGKAAAEYDASIAISPDAATYNDLGNVLIRLGNYDGAISAYKSAIASKPQLAHAYDGLGLALSAQDKYNEAIEPFNEAISRDNNPLYHCNKAKALLALKMDGDALECLNIADMLLKDGQSVLSAGNQTYIKESLEARAPLVEKLTKLVVPDIEARFAALSQQIAVLSSEVSYARKVNVEAELKSAQMKEIYANPKLKMHYETLLTTFTTQYATAHAISSGLLAPATDLKIILAEDILTAFIIVGNDVVKDVIAATYGFVHHRNLQQAASKLLAIAPNLNKFEEITEKLAREATLHPQRKEQLLSVNVDTIAEHQHQHLVAQCKELGKHVHDKFTGTKSKTGPEKLAHQSACVLIYKWMKDQITFENGVDIVDALIKSIITDIKDPPAQSAAHKHCIVMICTEIKYDNPILNNPALLKQVYEEDGPEALNMLINLYDPSLQATGESSLQADYV